MRTKYKDYSKYGFCCVWTWTKFYLASVSTLCTVRKPNRIITIFLSLNHRGDWLWATKLASLVEFAMNKAQGLRELTKSVEFFSPPPYLSKTGIVKPARWANQHKESRQDVRRHAASGPWHLPRGNSCHWALHTVFPRGFSKCSILQGTLCKYCLKRLIEQETRRNECCHLYSSKKKLKT